MLAKRAPAAAAPSLSSKFSVRRPRLRAQFVTPRSISSDASGGWEDAKHSECLLSFRRPHHERVEAPRGAPPLVLLPGFGNATRDYVAPFGREEDAIVTALKARGFDVYVLPMRRKDWLRVVRALFTPAYWSSSCTTAPGYTWYLERVKEVVDQARLECKADQVDLIGHSAGGWLGRAFIGQQQFKEGPDSSDFEPHEAVRSLVTLGTPHTPPPPEKAKDRTGGALTWTNTLYPGAFFAETHDLKYVSVAGRAVRGDKDADRRSLPGYAAGSYEEVCGDGHGVEGDAVVPLSSALLEGAQHVVLDGVYHSMSKIRTFNEPSGNIWYGSEEVLDAWLARLVS